MRFKEIGHLIGHGGACAEAFGLMNPLKRPHLQLSEEDIPIPRPRPTNPESCVIGGHESTLGDVPLDSATMASLYQMAGLSQEPVDPDLESEEPLPDPNQKHLFPDLEHLLAYTLFQQEGESRVSERNMNFFLMLMRDTRLDRSKFPANVKGWCGPFSPSSSHHAHDSFFMITSPQENRPGS